MVKVETLPTDPSREDPGAHWFQVFANQYPDQFVSGRLELLRPEDRPVTTEQDERGQDEVDAQIASGLFEHHRRSVRHLFQAVMREVFDTHNIPRSGGVDVGSGITGEMVNEWLPLSSKQLETWTETDISREAVAVNESRHPGGSKVKLASMYDLRKGLQIGRKKRVPVVTGLSSLGAPAFLERAVENIRDILWKGGHLVHVQDVRPGVHMGVDQMKHENEREPYTVGVAKPPGNMSIINPHVYIRSDGTIQSSVELFRRRLQRAIEETKGLRLVRSEWIRAEEVIDGDDSYVYVMNMRGPLPTDYTGQIASNTAYAVLTVAERV